MVSPLSPQQFAPAQNFGQQLLGAVAQGQGIQQNQQALQAGNQRMAMNNQNMQAQQQGQQRQVSEYDYQTAVRRLEVINRLAKHARNLPTPQEREQFKQSLSPEMLQSVGIDPAQLEQTPIDDKGLDALIAQTQAALPNQELENRKLSLQERGLDIQEKRLSSGGNIEKTAKQKEWEEYQRLKEENPDAASQFARATGFETREGQQLSSFAEKQIDGAFNEYTEASGNVSRYSVLAENLRKADMSGGLKSTWTEYIKEQTGNQDEITALRKEAKQIANSEGIRNLPPGPATDRDIEIVMSPFPTEKASPEYIANWLGAMSRLNEKRAQYAEFKADFISENGSVRNRDGKSLVAAWKESQAQQGGSGQGAATTGISGSSQSSSPSIDDLLRMY